jgi:hypothetical protein
VSAAYEQVQLDSRSSVETDRVISEHSDRAARVRQDAERRVGVGQPGPALVRLAGQL